MALSAIQKTMLRLHGFKKLPLKDTNCVLENKNNYKFMRDRIKTINGEVWRYVDTYLPSGTKVSKTYDLNHEPFEKLLFKEVHKPDGTSFAYTNGDNVVYKYFKDTLVGKLFMKK